MAATTFRRFGEITKYDENEDGSITVFGIASTGTRDSAGEIVLPDAMKAALPDYEKFPSIREMHQPIAAGHAREAYVDDDGVTHISAYIDDAGSVKKVKSGTLKGFSIGGKVLKRDPDDKSIITSLQLVEVSLVDRPCNPEATLTMWKADTMSDKQISSDEVVARAKEMATAAGRKAYKDYVFKARQDLTAEAAAAIVEPVDDDIAKAAEAAALAAAEAEAAQVVDDAAKAAVIDPAAALADALAVAKAAAAEPVAVVAPPAFDIDLAKAAQALTVIAGRADTEIAKGMYDIASLASVIDQASSLQSWLAFVAEDGSTIPAELASAIAALCSTLTNLVAEETAQIVADFDEAGIEIVVVDDDAFEYAAHVVDLVKADAALMEKAGARHSKADAEKIQDMHDSSMKLGAKCDSGNCEDAAKAEALAENERLAKALADAAPAVEQITKQFGDKFAAMETTIETLTKRLIQVESEPAAPKTAVGAHRTITKSQDVSPSTAEAHDTSAGGMTADDFNKAIDAMPEKDRNALMLKIALANPQIVKPGR